MRHLRNLAFFALGWLLVAVPMFAFAESKPATTSYPPVPGCTVANTTGVYTSIEAACNAYSQQQLGGLASVYSPATGRCTYTVNGNLYQGGSAACHPTCPNGGSYDGSVCQTPPTCEAGWTLQGSTCTRPDCPAGQTRDPATGLCAATCPQKDLGVGWYRSNTGTDLTGTYCTGGCEITLALSTSTGESYSTSSTVWMPLSKWQNGNTCTAPKPLPDSSASAPNTPPKNPPCATGEGVVALNSGAVYCVPPGTPGADVPKVSKQEQKQTFADGSTTTTITTNTCTGHGACSTTTTVTNTPATGGGQGQAGPVGTSQSKTDKPPTDQPDFCKANPNLQLCKGGMAEEGTQKSVLDTAKKSLEQLETITKPTFTDDQAVSQHKSFDSFKTQELKDADNSEKDHAIGTIDPVANPKSAWEQAMNSGWFTPVPSSSCAPFSVKAGPINWALDHCPIAEKLSQIGAYALWFILAIQTFVFVTGGRKA